MKEDIEMKLTDARKRANKKYYSKTYEKISFDSRKELRLRELLNLAALKLKTSIAQYAINAIQVQLAKDKITIDMLDKPIVQSESETNKPKQYMIYMVTSWNATPDEYVAIQNNQQFAMEDYVSVFQTLNLAKNYIKRKYTKKAYPENWYFTIYGRYIEADNKAEALDTYRKMAQDAVKEENDNFGNEDGWLDFLGILNQYRESDYVEVVKYDDVRNDMEES